MHKIVSDIDDTLMSSGGSFPAGCDRTYPRHCIYPGVLAFYSEMDICQALRVQVLVIWITVCRHKPLLATRCWLNATTALTSLVTCSVRDETPCPTTAWRCKS